ncbi:MAG: lipopolysaccharide biosynthesis protein [Terriglobales bacterium]
MTQAAAPTVAWETIPAGLRRPLLGGMRWTLWLALGAVPFSYGTRVLLARISPECLAIFGLLLVYINFVAAFLFLGGNAVAIRYLPQIETERRRDFLGSYVLVLAGAWLPWVVLAAVDPRPVHWLLGSLGGGEFTLLAILLAPLPILFSLLLAALKGALDIAAAQVLYRTVTLGTFAGVLVAFLWARPLLAVHAVAFLWTWYFLLMAGAAAAAARRWERCSATAVRGRPRWFLPAGFWRYTLGLQASSVLGFFATQLDMLLVLGAGGLRQLGEYVAIMALAALAMAALKLLLDAFMAAITHGEARRIRPGAEQDVQLSGELFRQCSRLLLPMILLLGAGLACLASPLLAIYGARYATLLPALRWLGPCAAIAGLNYLLGSSLSALGHPGAEVKAKCVRIAAYVALFFLLWPRLGIVGAVLAWGAAELPYQGMNLMYLRRLAPFPLRWRRLYPAYLAAVALLAAAVQWLRPTGMAAGICLWACIGGVFLVLAGYSWQELRGHARIFLPGSLVEVRP